MRECFEVLPVFRECNCFNPVPSAIYKSEFSFSVFKMAAREEDVGTISPVTWSFQDERVKVSVSYFIF